MKRHACLANGATLSERLLVHFDGSTEPSNPLGWSTYGWTVNEVVSGEELARGWGLAAPAGDPRSTNNWCEYVALGLALRFLADRGWSGGLLLRGDSLLVINQLTGQWRCLKPHLIALRDRCYELLNGLAGRDWRAEWIPREKNAVCDSLAQQAYVEATGEPYPGRTRRPRKRGAPHWRSRR
jgi:ribonuclease HI